MAVSEESNEVCDDELKMLSSMVKLDSHIEIGWVVESLMSELLPKTSFEVEDESKEDEVEDELENLPGEMLDLWSSWGEKEEVARLKVDG